MKKHTINVSVTGGCGFIGSAVAKKLAQNLDLSVTVVDIMSPKERGIKFPPNITFRRAGLRTPSNAEIVLQDADVVLHFAAAMGAISYMHEQQAEIITRNAQIDSGVFSALKKVKPQFVLYASSSMAFQEARDFPYREADLENIPPPKNIYGLSKLVGEYFCRAYYSQYNIPYVIVRFHNVYGPGEIVKGKNPGDIHVIPALIKKVLDGKYPLPLLGDPDATRSFLYIDDTAEAIVALFDLALLKDKRVLCNDFNLGSTGSIKISDLGKVIWKLLGDKRPYKYIVEKTSANTAKFREMDPEKITSIGWKPKTTLEKGMLKTSEWVKGLK